MRNICLNICLYCCCAFLWGCAPKKTTEADSKMFGKILSNVTQIRDTVSPSEALKYLDSTTNNLVLNAVDQREFYFKKHDLYLNSLHDNRMAEVYADSMLWLIKEKKGLIDSASYFNALKAKADACYALEKYDEAFRYYEKAKEIALNNNSPCRESAYLFRIALAYYHEELFLESARLFLRSYKGYTLCAKTNMEAIYREQEVLGNIGLAYERALMPDSALHFFYLSLATIQAKSKLHIVMQDRWLEALSVLYGNLGSTYLQLDKLDSAQKYLEQSIDINKKINKNIHDRQINLLKLATLHLKTGKYDLAKKQLQEEANLSKSNQAYAAAKESLVLYSMRTDVMGKYYYATKQYQDAIRYFHLHDSVEAMKWLLTNRILKNDLERGIDNIEHEKRITTLEKNLKIKELRIIIFVLLLCIAAGLILIIWKSYKDHKLKYWHLERTNEKITLESARKEERLNKKMRDDELNFMALIENTDDFLWSVDADLNLLAFNRAYKEYFFKLFGEYPEIEKPDLLKRHNLRAYEMVQKGYKSALSGIQYDIIDKGISFEGHAPDIEVRFKPIRNEQGNVTGVSCFRRDLTEYIGLIRILEKNNEQLKNIAWLQSHKLRGPLTTLQGIAVYLSQAEGDPQHYHEMLLAMMEKIKEMDGIIHEIVEETDHAD